MAELDAGREFRRALNSRNPLRTNNNHHNLNQIRELLWRRGVRAGSVITGEDAMPQTKSGGSKRGFAAMSPEKQREIASMGGKASHGGGRKSNAGR